MQTSKDQFPEQFQESKSWGPLTPDLISDLIHESNIAFEPPASSPHQTTTDLITEFHTDPHFQIFGYSINGKPISYIVALSNSDPDLLSIGPMFVSEEHKGQGLGKKQVEEFIEYARAAHYKGVYTKTWSKNIPARAIFDKLGFVHVKTKIADRSNGDSTVGYQITL